MKKLKKSLSALLVVIMMAMLLTPAASVASGLTITRLVYSENPVWRATNARVASAPYARYVQAQVYAARPNGSSIWSVGVPRSATASSGWINSSGTLFVHNSGWFV